MALSCFVVVSFWVCPSYPVLCFWCTYVPAFCCSDLLSGCARDCFSVLGWQVEASGSALLVHFLWVYRGVCFGATWVLDVRTCGIVVFSGMGYGSAMYILGGARILTVLSHCGFRWRVGLGCPGIILLSAFWLWAGLSSCWGTAVRGFVGFLLPTVMGGIPLWRGFSFLVFVPDLFSLRFSRLLSFTLFLT